MQTRGFRSETDWGPAGNPLGQGHYCWDHLRPESYGATCVSLSSSSACFTKLCRRTLTWPAWPEERGKGLEKLGLPQDPSLPHDSRVDLLTPPAGSTEGITAVPHQAPALPALFSDMHRKRPVRLQLSVFEKFILYP